ncbi:hypothetical protein FIBSPDRAFT_899876 [Athelia psychrophila]|uniref:Uncharacterized protein n=1 Tax=Athelia psychrophila TaxID=1759441 RepID=A0A165Z6Q9_9AGAM|nr:hypothetical protein FIBSPDRAFT_899876 [Fibularhizoctonia sp. CBS 109695]
MCVEGASSAVDQGPSKRSCRGATVWRCHTESTRPLTYVHTRPDNLCSPRALSRARRKGVWKVCLKLKCGPNGCNGPGESRRTSAVKQVVLLNILVGDAEGLVGVAEEGVTARLDRVVPGDQAPAASRLRRVPLVAVETVECGVQAMAAPQAGAGAVGVDVLHHAVAGAVVPAVATKRVGTHDALTCVPARLPLRRKQEVDVLGLPIL